MKKIIIFLMCVFTLQITIAQTRVENLFKGKLIPDYSSEKLSAQFKKYEIYEFDINELNEYVKSQKNSFPISLKLNDQYEWNMQLQLNDMRGAKYREVEITKDGLKELKKRNVNTYKGTLFDVKNSNVRLTIDKGIIFGFIFDGNAEIFIEPLTNFVKSKFKNRFIVYKSSDIIPDNKHKCGSTERNKYKKDFGINENEKLTMVCKELEIATAADYSMYQKFGSTGNTNNHILSILNLAEPNYSQFQLDFIVVDQFVVTCNGCDPWTTSVDGDILLYDFASWGPLNFNTHDDAELWTNRDFHKLGDYNVVGLAFQPGVCSNLQYSLLEDYSSSAQDLRVLCAHEMGHNFDGAHDAPNSGYIMQPSVDPSATTWSSASTATMSNYINISGCLSPCASVSNDDCANAIPITSNISCNYTSGTVNGASQSLGANQCTGCSCTSPDDYDVYYSFEALCTTHTITVDNIANNFDGVIEIRNSCVSGGNIQCYDPIGAISPVNYTYNNFTPGATYYIRIYEFDYSGTPPSSDDFDICVTHSCPIGNVNLVYSNQVILDGIGGAGVGNSNGIAEVGEEIDMEVELTNTGSADVHNVSAILSTTSPYINITDDSENFPDIAAGTSEWTNADFDFAVLNPCASGNVTFTLSITSDEGSWTDNFTVYIDCGGGAVNLSYSDQVILDGIGGAGVGNSNGIAEVGEEIDMEVELTNTGSADVHNVSAILSTTSPYINITDDSENFPDIAAGTSEWTNADFDFAVLNPCASGNVTFTLSITSDEGSWTDNFTVYIDCNLPNLIYSNHQIHDGTGGGSGNSNSLPQAGESIDMPIELFNTSSVDAHNVYGILSTTHPDITLTDDNEGFFDINSGNSAWSLSAYSFDVGSPCSSGNVNFTLNVGSDEGSWIVNFTVYIDCITSFQDNISTNFISIYPNPTDEQLNVLGEGLSNGVIEITLSNTLGQLLKNESINITNRSLKFKLNTKELPTGIYFLNIKTEKANQTFMVHKQ